MAEVSWSWGWELLAGGFTSAASYGSLRRPLRRPSEWINYISWVWLW